MAKETTTPQTAPTTEPAQSVVPTPVESTVEREASEQSPSLGAMGLSGYTRGSALGTGSSFVKEPGVHYLPVEKPHEKFPESQLTSYLSMESPTSPGTRMYWVATEDAIVTGSIFVVWLACTEEDYKAKLHEATDEAAKKVVKLDPVIPTDGKIVNRSTYDRIERTDPVDPLHPISDPTPEHVL